MFPFHSKYFDNIAKLTIAAITNLNILQVATAAVLLFLGLVNMHKGSEHRLLADRLNHISTGLIFLAMFCDVIKMNFSLTPAVHADRVDDGTVKNG